MISSTVSFIFSKTEVVFCLSEAIEYLVRNYGISVTGIFQ